VRPLTRPLTHRPSASTCPCRPSVDRRLCFEKNGGMICISLPEGDKQVHASRYQLYLPSEEQLREELRVERQRLDGARKFTPTEDGQ